MHVITSLISLRHTQHRLLHAKNISCSNTDQIVIHISSPISLRCQISCHSCRNCTSYPDYLDCPDFTFSSTTSLLPEYHSSTPKQLGTPSQAPSPCSYNPYISLSTMEIGVEVNMRVHCAPVKVFMILQIINQTYV